MIKEKNLTDELLLKRIANNCEISFKIIFDRYRTRFYAAAIKLTHSTDISEEIVQDVFVNLWTRRTVLASVENPSGYLFTILYNNIYSHLKKISAERIMRDNFHEYAYEKENSVENIINGKETRQLIYTLVHQLPSRQRQVYVLSKEVGLSRGEISERLDISPNTVKNHLQEAMKFMRANLFKIKILLLFFQF